MESQLNYYYSAGTSNINDVVIGIVQNHKRVHASWNPTIVRTGRLSCCKPNLQTIPNEKIISEVSWNIRELFCATPGGWQLVAFDYSQIEMRVLAHICQDAAMIQIFDESGDVYQLLASMIFEKHPEHISRIEREQAKVICLGNAIRMCTAAWKYSLLF